MKNISLSRLLAGGGIIFFGVSALFGSLDIINFSELFGTYWPVLLIGAGVLLLVSNAAENYLWAIILTGAGLVALLNNHDVVDVNFWQLFWPVVVIAIGLSILLQHTRVHSESSERIMALLSGFETKNSAPNYKGDKITAIMGGGVLDLRKATIKKEATIEVLAIMGGVELQIPEEWNVQISIMPILGGVENKAVSPQISTAPVLNIVGTALMGGIEIKN